MRAVIQRVERANVDVDDQCVGAIGPGLVILIGVSKEDSEKDADVLCDKILNLRIFADGAGKMNLSVLDTKGELLIISQFTLFGDCVRGRRPSFDAAALPGDAKRLYDYAVEQFRKSPLQVATGVFQAHMAVSLTNDGPVTIILDTKNLKR